MGNKVTWWHKCLSVILSGAMVMTTTPIVSLADDAEPADSVAIVEETEDFETTDDLTDAEGSEEGVIEEDEQVVIDDEMESQEGSDELLEPVVDDEVAAEEEAAPEEADPEPEPESVLEEQGVYIINGVQAETYQSLPLGGEWVDSDISASDITKFNETKDLNDLTIQMWWIDVEDSTSINVDVMSKGAVILTSFYSVDNGKFVTVENGGEEQRVDKNGYASMKLNLEKGMYYLWAISITPGKYAVRGYTTSDRVLTTGATYNGKTTLTKLSNKTYTGAAIKPTLKVVRDGKTLVQGLDYTFVYKNNKKVGKATMTIKGIGPYTGSKKFTFNIVKRKISKTKASCGVVAWTGKAVKPNPVIKVGSTTLKKGKDYTIVKYTNNKNVGKGSVTIKGKGGLTGTRTIKFKIRYNISAKKAVTGYYNPDTMKFTRFVFRKTGKTMVEVTDYKLKKVKTTSAGTVYKMTGKGKYSGTIYFTLAK